MRNSITQKGANKDATASSAGGTSMTQPTKAKKGTAKKGKATATPRDANREVMSQQILVP